MVSGDAPKVHFNVLYKVAMKKNFKFKYFTNDMLLIVYSYPAILC